MASSLSKVYRNTPFWARLYSISVYFHKLRAWRGGHGIPDLNGGPNTPRLISTWRYIHHCLSPPPENCIVQAFTVLFFDSILQQTY